MPVLRMDSASSLSPDTFHRRGRLTSTLRRHVLFPALAARGEGIGLLKRSLDIAFAMAALAALAPLFLVIALARWTSAREQEWLYRIDRIGRNGRNFVEFMFDCERVRRPFHRLPVLWNILRGDMSLVGPRPVSPERESPGRGHLYRRFDVQPGLICSWWLQRRANIAFDGEAAADRKYLEERSLGVDCGIALRAIPALIMGSAARPRHGDAGTHVLGLPLSNFSIAEALSWILETLAEKEGPVRRICFINPHCANVACRDAEYREALETSDVNLADGIGMVLAGKITGKPIKENANGTDLFPRLCRALEGSRHGIFLLGGRPGVADDVAAWIRRNYPGTSVSGAHHGFFSPGEEAGVLELVRESGAKLLLVAMGVPRQDVWVRDHAAGCGVRVALGVGGLFDFYSGRIPRAPLWMREAGFEWFFRFAQEPQRLFSRYFVGNFLFLGRVLRRSLPADSR